GFFSGEILLRLRELLGATFIRLLAWHRAAAHFAKGLVAGNAIEPRHEGVGILESIDLLVDVDPGFLEQVVGRRAPIFARNNRRPGEYRSMSSRNADSSPPWQRRTNRRS